MKKQTIRILLILALSGVNLNSYGQVNDRISTMDFVQIVNGNEEEAKYYFKNNWQILREMAIKKGHIHSYQFLETPPEEGANFQFVLITTYKDATQYKLREEHFAALIAEKGPLKLLNEIQPGDFRKSLFTKERVKHLR